MAKCDETTTTFDDIARFFTYHAPNPDNIKTYKDIRQYGFNFASYLLDNVPHSDERTLALEKLREVVMWANAAIACDANNKS